MKDLMRQRIAIDTSLETVINAQIKMEAQSSSAYLAMAAWCDAQGYENSATFFYDQAEEERAHMLKLFKFISDMGAQPISPEVAAVNHDFSSLREVFESALEMEIAVTESINAIVVACRKVNDFATESFMGWFVKEQVEEEFIARRAVELLDMLSNDDNGLVLFDDRVLNITYTNPYAPEEGE